jgi:hypothetical protein
MEHLDYTKLIKERKVYYIKYGRGAVIGVACESLEEEDNMPDIYSVIRREHGNQQNPILITSIDFSGDHVIFDIIVAPEEDDVDTGNAEPEYRVTKKIPLSQITFENYQLNN